MIRQKYCKRLIEKNLPIRKISTLASKEKWVKQGNISSSHVWWARKPLASSRAILLASLLLDPCDENCPESYLKKLYSTLENLYPGIDNNKNALLKGSLRLVEDYANWEFAKKNYFLQAIKKLISDTNKLDEFLMLDPFAGGGSIPLEGIRLGLNVFSSDINPVAVVINKFLLEYVPKFHNELIDKLSEAGQRVYERARKRLARYYIADSTGFEPTAHIWMRTCTCEGPGCGTVVPMTNKMWLSKKERVALRFIIKNKKVNFEILENVSTKDVQSGTVKRGSLSCPVCGYTTPLDSVVKQLHQNKGGANSSRLVVIIETKKGGRGRRYRLADNKDLEMFFGAKAELDKMIAAHGNQISLIPNEPLPPQGTLGFRVLRYGMKEWGDLFNFRQSLALAVFCDEIKEVESNLRAQNINPELTAAIVTGLAIALDRLTNSLCSLSYWNPSGPKMQAAFVRQAVSMVWDYCEASPFGGSVGDWLSMVECVKEACLTTLNISTVARVEKVSATKHSLPSDISQLIITDPPYYNAVPYSFLSDFFYVWLKRTVGHIHKELFETQLSPKEDEILMNDTVNDEDPNYKDRDRFEADMVKALTEIRRIMKPDGLSVIIFAHKSTEGWEALLNALLSAGLVVTASWPIATEMETRLRAMDSAALGSSINLVCRARENEDGIVIDNYVGDWRDVLQELPRRVHEWLPRLSEEGIVGADAIFACLGPALEVFSKYSRVEKANGEKVELREYLEQIWGAVSKEALNMIFQGAHTEGFEEDARLTAMWLWTLSAGSDGSIEADEETADDTDSEGGGIAKTTGFSLEFDAARKIAQGLGAHLENLSSVIEVKGDQARLLPVAERVNFLFGKGSMGATPVRKKKKENQITLFDEFNKVEEQGWSLGDEKSAVGKTILDRLHQAMILFGAGRGDAMRRFLVEEGIGKDERFWRLAQALSALYPANTDEKRWVDGVLARKKGLGF